MSKFITSFPRFLSQSSAKNHLIKEFVETSVAIISQIEKASSELHKPDQEIDILSQDFQKFEKIVKNPQLNKSWKDFDLKSEYGASITPEYAFKMIAAAVSSTQKKKDSLNVGAAHDVYIANDEIWLYLQQLKKIFESFELEKIFKSFEKEYKKEPSQAIQAPQIGLKNPITSQKSQH